jgi:hypothetical protein
MDALALESSLFLPRAHGQGTQSYAVCPDMMAHRCKEARLTNVERKFRFFPQRNDLQSDDPFLDKIHPP